VSVASDRYHPVRCSSCHAPIFFAKTAAGRLMPLNATPVEVVGKWTIENGVAHYRGIDFQGIGFVAHWTTCPDAGKFRRRDGGGK
jgi:hypothetical protein